MTTKSALTIAREIATVDLICADNPSKLAARIIDADDYDSCLDCEWTIAAIVEQTGCDEATAERAIGLYARALREMAAIRCAA